MIIMMEKLIKNYHNFNELPNLLIYGIGGCGKKYNLYKLLEYLGNSNIYKKKIVEYNSKIHFYQSCYHIEIDLLHYNLNDKNIIDQFLKEYVTTKNISFDIPKIIVFLNAHYLSYISQCMLRRIIEKNYQTSRYIFVTNYIQKIIEPLRSRFLLVRIPAPNKLKMKIILKEYFKDNIKDKIIDKNIINNGNIRLNINNLLLIQKKIKNEENYELVLNIILKSIINKKFQLKKYYEIRNKIYDLYTDNVDENKIFKYILNYVLKNNKISDEKKMIILKETAMIEHKMVLGNKEPIYIEKLFFVILKNI